MATHNKSATYDLGFVPQEQRQDFVNEIASRAEVEGEYDQRRSATFRGTAESMDVVRPMMRQAAVKFRNAEDATVSGVMGDVQTPERPETETVVAPPSLPNNIVTSETERVAAEQQANQVDQAEQNPQA